MIPKKVPSVLIVDDNSFDVLFTKKVLMKTGRFEHVFAVSDGAEAMALFENYERSRRDEPDGFPPLVILLDINMPLMNGFEFLEAYARLGGHELRDPSIVVMLTSSSFQDDRAKAMESALVKDYVVKPMTRTRAIELAESFGR